VAILGTTISPYLFFWQSMHRLEEMREEPEGGSEPEQLCERSDVAARKKEWTSRFDVFFGMAFSNIVMFSIIVTTAATLGKHGKHNIQSAADAASALKPIAGRFASTLFALGFVGAGVLAIPVLAGAGSAGMAGLLGKATGFCCGVPFRAAGFCSAGRVRCYTLWLERLIQRRGSCSCGPY